MRNFATLLFSVMTVMLTACTQFSSVSSDKLQVVVPESRQMNIQLKKALSGGLFEDNPKVLIQISRIGVCNSLKSKTAWTPVKFKLPKSNLVDMVVLCVNNNAKLYFQPQLLMSDDNPTLVQILSDETGLNQPQLLRAANDYYRNLESGRKNQKVEENMLNI